MYKLSVVTPEKVVYESDVTSIVAPGMVGYLGIMTNHAPIITALAPGKLKITDAEGKEINLVLTGGFLENSNNSCTILADAAEFAGEIDLDRAQDALNRARQRIANAAGEIDVGRAREAIERAKARILVAREK